ncbi:hypothetical protein B0H13DRAFT_2325740 [Mycena leptocephala]|nr:hypothetical protein B0H13DRAFT_2325740 [Mycena leptocephala]
MAPIQRAIVVLATFLFTGVHAFPSGSIRRVHPRQSVIVRPFLSSEYIHNSGGFGLGGCYGNDDIRSLGDHVLPLSASISDTTPASSDVVTTPVSAPSSVAGSADNGTSTGTATSSPASTSTDATATSDAAAAPSQFCACPLPCKKLSDAIPWAGDNGANCINFLITHAPNISTTMFTEANPDVGSICSNLHRGQQYCLQAGQLEDLPTNVVTQPSTLAFKALGTGECATYASPPGNNPSSFAANHTLTLFGLRLLNPHTSLNELSPDYLRRLF